MLCLIACSQYYLDTQVLPSLFREHKLHAAWSAAGKRYYDSIWKFNYRCVPCIGSGTAAQQLSVVGLL